MKLSQMMIMNIYTAASGLSLHLVMAALLVSSPHTQHFYTVVRTYRVSQKKVGSQK